ncbi:hypothetical protein L210DRAFT_3559498, partial [Boletus edulis BED1]
HNKWAYCWVNYHLVSSAVLVTSTCGASTSRCASHVVCDHGSGGYLVSRQRQPTLVRAMDIVHTGGYHVFRRLSCPRQADYPCAAGSGR